MPYGAISYSGRVVHLWHVDSGNDGPVIVHEGGQIPFFTWSPDGNLLACGSSAGSVLLYETATGELQKVLAMKERFLSLTFSPNGTQLATANVDYTDSSVGHRLRSTVESARPSLFPFWLWLPDDLDIGHQEENGVELWDIVTGNRNKYPPLLMADNDEIISAIFIRGG